ncbi:MarR family winged helix-turn-helix transcriptional regulator [Streptomyces sp. 8L]|uniref:MarR family winged helix-turn-helix transcriptional regulator n=1 Tax=unclassified Streptomyces TaxID=2593676 RepID=UPI001CD23D2D|nr:MarR family winged helix-turn-helix transcriptional regulator [Streptomyces sp. 8L]MCA1221647.1 MarR family winged helix-turn-helix transcriptional regulator [Streptomyces sp. 8L]
MDAPRPQPPAETLREAAETLAASAEAVTEISVGAAAAVDPWLLPHRLRVLRLVADRPGVNLTGLAAGTGMTLPRASRMCAALESAQLIERRPVRQDRREIGLVLSERGSALLADYRALCTERIAEILRAMPGESRTELLEGLRSFVSSLADAGDL